VRDRKILISQGELQGIGQRIEALNRALAIAVGIDSPA
jgi:hypothetical protein